MIQGEFKKLCSVCAHQIFLADLSQDGLDEIIITYSNSDNSTEEALYTTTIYQIVGNCAGKFNCEFERQPIKGDLLKDMTAVPSLVNFDGEGSPSFLTFSDR